MATLLDVMTQSDKAHVRVNAAKIILARLAAIPEPIVQLFGVVMVGYSGGRSWEKVRGVSK